MEPENTGPLEKENHLPKHHFQVLMLIFGGVSCLQQIAKALEHWWLQDDSFPFGNPLSFRECIFFQAGNSKRSFYLLKKIMASTIFVKVHPGVWRRCNQFDQNLFQMVCNYQLWDGVPFEWIAHETWENTWHVSRIYVNKTSWGASILYFHDFV